MEGECKLCFCTYLLGNNQTKIRVPTNCEPPHFGGEFGFGLSRLWVVGCFDQSAGLGGFEEINKIVSDPKITECGTEWDIGTYRFKEQG